MIIKSWLAFLIYCLLISMGMIWNTFYPSAPYGVFAPTLTTGFLGYVAKRLIQKKFNNNGDNNV